MAALRKTLCIENRTLDILLLFPPVAKPGEPPAGLASLAGWLSANGKSAAVIDANLEGMDYLLGLAPAAHDTWTRRAHRNLSGHLDTLRDPTAFRHLDRYKRAVADISRALETATEGSGLKIGLANAQSATLDPVKSADLLEAAENFAANPYFPYFEKRLTPAIEAGVSVVGISLNYLNQALCTFAMAGFLRWRFPTIKIVLGGGLVTSWMARPKFANPFSGLIDELVQGPGEPWLAAATGHIGLQSEAVPNYLPFDLKRYLSPGLVIAYSASRGCYWNRCRFCPERAEKSPYRPMPVSRAVSALDQLTRRHRPALVHLLDNAVSPAMLSALVRHPPGAPWYGFVRFFEALSDVLFCRDLRKSGCVMLKLGLESGDQAVLDQIDKGIDLNLVSRLLSALHQADIATYVYLLFGTLAETEAGAKKTLEFVASHSNDIMFLNLAIFNLPAFSPDADDLCTDSFYEGDLSLYRDFRHPAGWCRGRVRIFLDREFKRHTAIQPILRRNPPVFTSNHAPFFAMGSQGFSQRR